MEDENETKEEEQDQPSTSKKERMQDEELSDNTRQDQRVSTSVTSMSSYLSRSRINVTEAQPDATKVAGITKRGREAKTQVRRKKLLKRSGRIAKRQRSFARRHAKSFSRRKPRVKEELKSSEQSVTTIFTRLSSRSASRVQLCSNCGHRCCRRRAEMIQAGSRSAMLSPLFVNNVTDPAPNDTVEEKPNSYCEVSPQIIHDSLKKLSVWRQYVMTGDLMDYIRRTYPVNQTESELYNELKEKLRVAAIAGIVIEPYEDNWCLTCAMKDRQLSPNHVTLFWEAYVDTISPLRKTSPRVKEVESSDLAVESMRRRDII